MIYIFPYIIKYSMNQILVTKKLYITPELKRKKKIYKVYLIISVFLIIILTSIYIYAEYDRNKSELVSQEILSEIEDNTIADSNVLVVALSSDFVDEGETNVEDEVKNVEETDDNEYTETIAGYNYAVVATINIPKINVQYPIFKGQTGSKEETTALLKYSPIEFWGHGPNKVGNFCVAGHNYRNTKFFSKVPTLQNGDIIEITADRKTVQYEVYDNFVVDPNDNSCTSQLTNGERIVTLITCTNDSQERVIVQAREIKNT